MERFPGGFAALEHCKPVYEEHPGWDSPTASVTRLEELPREARSYVDRLQELINCSIDIISTGPHRHETVLVRPVLSTPSSV
jgi:adenylosuccinate synthase